MKEFHGIQVYEILESGNLLNGIYTNTRLLLNNDSGYHIDSEIARKDSYNNKGVDGLYVCRYIETDIKTNNSSVKHGDLTISQLNDEGVYKFTWSNANGPIWTGLGLMVGTTHIAVSYVGV